MKKIITKRNTKKRNYNRKRNTKKSQFKELNIHIEKKNLIKRIK